MTVDYSGAAVFAFATLAIAAWSGCGIGVTGTGADQRGTGVAPSATSTSVDPTAPSDDGGDFGVDAGADATSSCSACSASCLDGCSECSDAYFCLASSTCASDCDSCPGATSSCDVCNADGTGAHRHVCSATGPAGVCATSTYAHCACKTEEDCGASQVCAGGFCRLCGEPGSDGFACNGKGCDTCTASTGDCHCD